MLTIQEIALLLAVAVPAAAIAGLNIWLFAWGERGTLLLPAVGGYPAVGMAQQPQPVAAQEAQYEDPIRLAA